MTGFEGRAAGKVILLGEHAVVYGVPGIAAGIEKGARARAELSPPGARSTLRLGDQDVRDGDASDLARAFAALAGAGRPVRVVAEAELPPGGGLGCSAALAVAIARAVRAARGEPDDPDAVLEHALAWERVFHGNPSGIDTAAAAHATCLRFERGAGVRPIQSPVDLWLAIGHSGASASTREMVEGVARLRERRPEVVGKFLDGVRALVENAVLAIQAGDAFGLGRLLDMNQMLLAGVMLSTDAIEDMCRSAREGGALGAKLTGSGGGGCVIALGGASSLGERGSEAEAIAARVAERWSSTGSTAFVTRIEGSGSTARGPA
jgi:mevalonate kinase